jgi:predicted acylesterase/phospholipase RssA
MNADHGERGAALVLAGAVAKGSFGVGASSVVAQRNVRIRRIAATSSGALTSAVLGAGVATGQLAYAAEVATDLWLDHGAWTDIQHVSLTDWFHARGLLDTSRLVAITLEGIRRVVERSSAVPVACRVTFLTTSVAPLRDTVSPLPTYERSIHFDAADFVDATQWEAIATAAAASATFPGVFAPTEFEGSPYIDGGAVNNAPIGYVLDDPAVSRVFVITSEATELQPPAKLGGLDLIAKIADVAINERISHDLGVAKRANERLASVKAALGSTGASPQTTDAVLRALGWRDVDLVVISPGVALPGNAFAGFFDRALRQAYIQAGIRAAEEALSARA